MVCPICRKEFLIPFWVVSLICKLISLLEKWWRSENWQALQRASHFVHYVPTTTKCWQNCFASTVNKTFAAVVVKATRNPDSANITKSSNLEVNQNPKNYTYATVIVTIILKRRLGRCSAMKITSPFF